MANKIMVIFSPTMFVEMSKDLPVGVGLDFADAYNALVDQDGHIVASGGDTPDFDDQIEAMSGADAMIHNPRFIETMEKALRTAMLDYLYDKAYDAGAKKA